MSQTHYKLPVDEELDKDILDWINSFPRNKKGEMVRHAIRYYMIQNGEEARAIKYPSSQESVKPRVGVSEQSKVNKRERKKPMLNSDALK